MVTAALLAAAAWVAAAAPPALDLRELDRRVVAPVAAYARDLAEGDRQAKVRLLDMDMALNVALAASVESRVAEGVYVVHQVEVQVLQLQVP